MNRARRLKSWAFLLGLGCWGATWAVAQPAGAAPAGGERLEARLAANEEHLWLAQVGGAPSKLFHRSVGQTFQEGVPVHGRVAELVAAGPDVFVFFENRALYRYFEGGSMPELTLSPAHDPVHVVAVPGKLYAIAPSEAAEHWSDSEPAASEPHGPLKDAPLSLFSYDGHRWTWLAACPPTVAHIRGAAPRLRPRLCLVRGTLFLFWHSAAGGPLRYAPFDPAAGRWLPEAGALDVPGLRAFWTAAIGGVLTVAVAVDAPAGGETLGVYRLLGDPQKDGADAWQRVQREQLRFAGPRPDEAGGAQYLEAFSFNQHLGLLTRSADGQGRLEFARVGDVPTLPGVPLADVFFKRDFRQQVYRPLQVLMFLAFLGILGGLFMFRRGSMFQLLELPAGWAFALALQRLLAFLIDFLPWLLAAALATKTPWLDGLRQISEWAIGSDLTRGGLPATEILIWWGLSVGLYAAYSLLLELLTRRTLGKLLTGVHLLAESGARPAAWQILLRNLTRVLELLPPLWPLGFLIVLTRNRQRFGDVLARTILVRRAEAGRTEKKDDPANPDAPPSDRRPPDEPPDGASRG